METRVSVGRVLSIVSGSYRDAFEYSVVFSVLALRFYKSSNSCDLRREKAELEADAHLSKLQKQPDPESSRHIGTKKITPRTLQI